MKQPVPIFDSTVIQGEGRKALKYHPGERNAIFRWIQTFPLGTQVEHIIRRKSKKRTTNQNRYYWGTVIPILALHFGHDNPEDMHEDLKLEFNPIESKITPGKKIGGTTTQMSTVDFFSAETSYVERICRWASVEHSLYIPPPTKVESGE